MRVVRKEADLLSTIATTRTEAGAAFGTDEVYMEKFLENPRHIEIQVIGRYPWSCRAFRRTGLFYAAPSSKSIRRSACSGHYRRTDVNKSVDVCVEACLALGYRGAGTFEFLYENGKFYFIEMNTRVQVEHPITEMITGIDIVREQITIAAGEPLSFTQEEVKISVMRSNAVLMLKMQELSCLAPGVVTRYHPPGGFGVRMDSHLYSGYKVPPYYDSLIGKLIVYGKTREIAIVAHA